MGRTQRLLAVPAGAIAGVLALGLFAATGLALGWLVLGDASRADRARAALLWIGPSGLLALAIGGWVAVRLGRVQHQSRALWVGIATGLSTVLLVVALADQFAGDAADPRSVYVALGIQEPAAPAAVELGVPVTTPAEDAAESTAASFARTRALQTVGYGGVVMMLHLVAGGLGGVLGVFPSARDHECSRRHRS